MNKFKNFELGDLIEFQRGYDLPKSNFIKGNVPVISSNGVLGYHNEAKVKAPGVTIGRSGTVGLPHFINEDFFPHNTSLFIKNFKGNNPKYIFYLLKTLKLNEYKSGSGVPTMNRNHLHPLNVYGTKDIFIQQKISSVLSALDDKIEINNCINTELEQMAKTLYDYWFVQFDFPNEEGKSYKSSGGKMVYNEVLKREIPKGWEVKSLEKFLKYNRGISYTSKSIDDYKGIPMINLKSFNLNGTYREDGIKYYNGNYNSEKLLSKNDILIAITDVTREAEIIGKSVFVPDLGENILCSCDVAQVIPNEAKLNKSYLKFLFNSQYYHNYIKHFASGTLVLHLDLNGVNWFTHAIPSIEIQNHFGEFVENIESKISSNMQQNKELSALRDWLLPMLMNGQLKVEE